MKKLLALVMALVMVLGLATVGANAAPVAYADADDITYTEAVDVMSAIGILGGDESGFRPTDTLKRSEGAKIVAYLMLGNKAAESMTGSGTKYTDLPANHWAAGYMEYLTSVGVMGGIGDGKIDPDGQLTTTAYAKMLLTALGYDAEIEGFGGSDWAINVQRIANKVDLFDGNDSATPSAAVTREEAALYGFNVLRTPLVEYDSNVRINTADGGSITVGNNSAKYKISDSTAKQTIDNAEDVNSTAMNRKFLIEFAEEYYKDLVLVGQDYQQDDLGRPIRKWTLNNAEIGTYVAKNALIKTWTAKVSTKDIYDLLGKTTLDSLSSAKWMGTGNALSAGTVLMSHEDGLRSDDTTGNTHYVGTNRWWVPIGYNAANPIDADDLVPYIHRTNTAAVNHSGNGTVTELYMDSDHNVNIVTYHTYLYQAVGDYNEKTQTLTVTAANDTTAAKPLSSYKLALADFPEIADMKDDDYILGAIAQTGANQWTMQSVAKAEVLTGTVDTYDTGANQSVTIDGTKHSYSKMTDDAAKDTMFTVGQKATVVLDAYDNVIAIDKALVTSDYAFVLDWGSTSNLAGDARAKVVFSDGTTGEVTVKGAYDYSGVNGTTGTNNGNVTSKTTIANWHNVAANRNKWFTYSKNASNEYTFYAAESKYTQATVNVVGTNGVDVPVSYNNKAVFLSGANYLANDETIVIVSDRNDDISVFTGVKNTPEITLNKSNAASAASYVLYRGATRYASLVYIDVNGASTVSGGAGENLIYVTTYKTQTKTTDGETFFVYKTLDGETEVEVQADKNITNSQDVYDAAFYVSRNAKDQLTGFEAMPTNDQKGSVYGYRNQSNAIVYDDGTLKVGDQTFTVNENTKLTLVKRAAALKTDTAKAFEVQTGTGLAGARNLANTLKGYGYTYRYGAKATSATSMVLSEIYITIENAVAATQVNGSSNAATSATNITNATNGLGSSVYANVTVNGAATSNAFNVSQYQTLTFTDDFTTVNGQTYNFVGGNVTVNGDLINAGRINLSSGATLTVNGKITDTGSIYVDGSQVYFNGTSGNTIGGSSIHASNGATVVFTGAVAIIDEGVNKGKIEISGSNFDVKGTLTITSTQTNALDIKSSSDVKIESLVLNTTQTNSVSIDQSEVEVETTEYKQNSTITVTGTAANTNVNLGEVVADAGVTATVTADANTTTIEKESGTGSVSADGAGAAIGTVTVTMAAKPTFSGTANSNRDVSSSISGAEAVDSNENTVKVVSVTVKTVSELDLKNGDGGSRTYLVAGDVIPVTIRISSSTALLTENKADYTVSGWTISEAELKGAEDSDKINEAAAKSAVELTTSYTVKAADLTD